ncbi:2-dehydropantoate 2-reductase [Pseudoroseomonas deserti]|uniref:2-dehydropantoate 2-reductase n=1 Tax=Teichococcus deserti TaxID=1817963 RepID=A0A1V2H067_9PROT|nr:2-dehydropantoate 2-reductase N-terminal domain-containing protein [Pseudoroseomonas deserti]ONG50991.1 2-dehydropantoate 2-reductase [Pseudoroseomonas deserti]
MAGPVSESIIIWGAGAIGGTIGAYLVRAGHDVTFVDVVEEHVAAINAEGLTIDGPVAAFTMPARAVTPAQLTGQHRLILLAVKAHHTEAATRALLPHLAADGAVVSCQNGLNELIIADIVGRARTIGAFVNFGADYIAPGRITYGGRGAVVVGELDGATTPRITALHKLMLQFDEDAVLSDNIFGYLWGKGGYGAILKSSALTNDSIADYIADPARAKMLRALVREVLTIARAEGVSPLGFNGFDPAAFLDQDEPAIQASMVAMENYNRGSAKSHSGIWRDLAVRKRPTDAGAQLAPMQAAARRHGLPTPLVDRLVALIAAVERGERQIGDGLAEELGALA